MTEKKANAGQNSQAVAQMIERDIYLGALAPGMWLKQIDMQQRYSCRRIVARHALEHVVSGHLVRHLPNRGYRVDEFSEQKIHEITKVRAMLEIAAAGDVMKNIDRRTLDQMETLARQFEKAIVSGTVEEQDTINESFHSKMLQQSGNDTLVELIFELRRRLPIAVRRLKNTQTRLAKAACEHFDIVDALRRKELGRLHDLLAEHIVLNPLHSPG